jgi:hypothetical protein
MPAKKKRQDVVFFVKNAPRAVADPFASSSVLHGMRSVTTDDVAATAAAC